MTPEDRAVLAGQAGDRDAVDVVLLRACDVPPEGHERVLEVAHETGHEARVVRVERDGRLSRRPVGRKLQLHPEVLLDEGFVGDGSGFQVRVEAGERVRAVVVPAGHLVDFVGGHPAGHLGDIGVRESREGREVGDLVLHDLGHDGPCVGWRQASDNSGESLLVDRDDARLRPAGEGQVLRTGVVEAVGDAGREGREELVDRAAAAVGGSAFGGQGSADSFIGTVFKSNISPLIGVPICDSIRIGFDGWSEGSEPLVEGGSLGRREVFGPGAGAFLRSIFIVFEFFGFLELELVLALATERLVDGGRGVGILGCLGGQHNIVPGIRQQLAHVHAVVAVEHPVVDGVELALHDGGVWVPGPRDQFQRRVADGLAARDQPAVPVERPDPRILDPRIPIRLLRRGR